jgi:hypothetical protein
MGIMKEGKARQDEGCWVTYIPGCRDNQERSLKCETAQVKKER